MILATGVALNPGLLVANLAEPLINREFFDGTVNFLISEKSKGITGQVIHVDNGTL